jgi:hypothetical protein
MAHAQARAIGGSTRSTSPLSASTSKPSVAFQPRSRSISKRTALQRVVASSNPVATVEKTLEKAASTVADSAKAVVEEVTPTFAKQDLDNVILLQGAQKVSSFCPALLCLQNKMSPSVCKNVGDFYYLQVSRRG